MKEDTVGILEADYSELEYLSNENFLKEAISFLKASGESLRPCDERYEARKLLRWRYPRAIKAFREARAAKVFNLVTGKVREGRSEPRPMAELPDGLKFKDGLAKGPEKYSCIAGGLETWFRKIGDIVVEFRIEDIFRYDCPPAVFKKDGWIQKNWNTVIEDVFQGEEGG